MQGFMSASELATKWGYDGAYIRREIYAGRLTGEKVGKTWFIHSDEKLAAWEANPNRNSRTGVVKEGKRKSKIAL